MLKLGLRREVFLQAKKKINSTEPLYLRNFSFFNFVLSGTRNDVLLLTVRFLK